jgi:hypothetical protein
MDVGHPTKPSWLAGRNPKYEPWRALPLGFPRFVREGQGILRHCRKHVCGGNAAVRHKARGGTDDLNEVIPI